MMSEPLFKTCGFCGKCWRSREELLSDPHLKVVGYQADFEKLELGLVMLNHTSSGCGTTLALFIGDFFDLYTGQRYSAPQALTQDCPRYCIDNTQLSRCDQACECALAREALNAIRERLDAAKAKGLPIIEAAE